MYQGPIVSCLDLVLRMDEDTVEVYQNDITTRGPCMIYYGIRKRRSLLNPNKFLNDAHHMYRMACG